MDMSKLHWRKATASGGDGGNCVEVTTISAGDEGFEEMAATYAAHKPGQTRYWLVRDSKQQGGPVLVYDDAEWEAFTAGVRAGEFSIEALTTA